jgi:hypothetical protein
MDVLEIIASSMKPREKVDALAAAALSDPGLVGGLLEAFKAGSVPAKGTCMEAIEAVSAKRPELVLAYIDTIIEAISMKPPRVKWESSRTVANIAALDPAKASKAIPSLLENTAADGTVVRWSAAFALSEIARRSPARRAGLLERFKKILEAEKNGGVRKIYEKALKDLSGHGAE